MNIFALSDSPHESAVWQHDRHVVKMILESAQMLSTLADQKVAFRDMIPMQYRDRLYKPTHVNHPCNVWLRQDVANQVWLALHLDSLVGEYHRRFQKVHKTTELMIAFNQVACRIAGVERLWERDENRNLRRNPMVEAVASRHTPFAVCMPDEFKSMASQWGAVDAYQILYLESKIFQQHVKWTRCDSLPRFIESYRYDDSRVGRRVAELVEAHARAGTVPKPDLSRPLLTPYTPKPNPKAILRFNPSK